MNDNVSTDWLPSSKLRQWMLIGTLAVFVDICLSTVSLSINLSREEDPAGVSITDILDSFVVIPEIFVLMAFLALAREVGSIGLWKSSIGVFGCLWLLTSLVFTSDEGWHWWDTAIGLAMVIGIVGLFVMISRSPAAFSETQSPDAPTDDANADDEKPIVPVSSDKEKEQGKGSSGWGCGTALGAALVAKLVMRGVKRGLRNVNIDWLVAATLITGAVLLCSLSVFMIWFGMAKIRLRHRLGKIAAVCGATDIISVVLYLSFLAFTMWITIDLAMNNQEPDFRDPRFLIPLTGISLFDILWKVLIGALFISVKNQVSSPWDPELEQPGRYIDRR